MSKDVWGCRGCGIGMGVGRCRGGIVLVKVCMFGRWR